jgi:protein-tyrosine-phosphatase
MSHHPIRLLFVCSGNINRSPMAAGIAQVQADRIGLDIETRSAGILGIVDKPAAPNAVYVCREIGADLSDHRSAPLTDELLAWADRVVVMELEHSGHIHEYFSRYADKVILLGPFGGVEEVPDPNGKWVFTYRRVRRLLETCVEGLLRKIA